MEDNNKYDDNNNDKGISALGLDDDGDENDDEEVEDNDKDDDNNGTGISALGLDIDLVFSRSPSWR